MSAGSEVSRLLEESQDTFLEHDPTSDASATEHADLDIKFVKNKHGVRTWTYSGVEYVVIGHRAGEYLLSFNTAGKKLGAGSERGAFQTLDDCKARIRMRLNHDIKRYGRA